MGGSKVLWLLLQLIAVTSGIVAGITLFVSVTT
jgi:hypothetical protein